MSWDLPLPQPIDVVGYDMPLLTVHDAVELICAHFRASRDGSVVNGLLIALSRAAFGGDPEELDRVGEMLDDFLARYWPPSNA
jgi:hypothetical protein